MNAFKRLPPTRELQHEDPGRNRQGPAHIKIQSPRIALPKIDGNRGTVRLKTEAPSSFGEPEALGSKSMPRSIDRKERDRVQLGLWNKGLRTRRGDCQDMIVRISKNDRAEAETLLQVNEYLFKWCSFLQLVEKPLQSVHSCGCATGDIRPLPSLFAERRGNESADDQGHKSNEVLPLGNRQ